MGIVNRIGHATFQTPDIERQVEYYTQVLGLALVDRTPNRAFLACPQDHRSIALELGDSAACTAIALEAEGEEELALLKARLAESGLKAEAATDVAPSVRQGLKFRGPGNFDVEVTLQRAESGHDPGPDVIGPHKLGHVAFKVADVQGAVRFFKEILDFRESDWQGDFFAFLRCGPDHHTVNFLRNENEKMHHIAFELRDMEHIQRACDFLGSRQMPLIWGPGRHGPGHNVFTYHHNPDGQIVELFCQLDRMSDESQGYFDPRPWHEDNPQRPKVWEPGLFTSNKWGIPSPESFRK